VSYVTKESNWPGTHIKILLIVDTGYYACRVLAKEEKNWLPQQTLLVDQLKKLWYSNDFHNRLGKVGTVITTPQ